MEKENPPTSENAGDDIDNSDIAHANGSSPGNASGGSESDHLLNEVSKSFTPLLGCLGWMALLIIVLLGLIQVYGAFQAAVAADLERNNLKSLPIGGTGHLSYEFFAIVGMILFMMVVLSSFPVFLQRSFELTKKARIQSDVWIDLLSLGYWTKLKLSADANDRLVMGRQKSSKKIEGTTRIAKLAQGMQALSVREIEVSSSEPYVSALEQFTKRFEENYGRQAFAAPLIMVAILYLIGWLSVLFPNGLSGGAEYGIGGVTSMFSRGVGGYLLSLRDNLNIVTAAFLGAYLFSVQGLFRRYLRSDFKPIAVTQASLRVLTAWIVAFLLVLLPLEEIYPDVSKRWLQVVGFFVGIFSLQVLGWIWDLTVKRIPNLLASFTRLANTELTELDGLDSWHQDRLDEAGINYVRGLATSDFLDLLIGVRLPCETLVDWVDQAILRMHVNKQTWKKLQKETPIRTASDMLDTITAPNDHRANLIKLMDDSSFADTLVLMEDALRQDPNIAHIRVFREQMHRVVGHKDAYPPKWPILPSKLTLTRKSTTTEVVIQTPPVPPGTE